MGLVTNFNDTEQAEADERVAAGEDFPEVARDITSRRPADGLSEKAQAVADANLVLAIASDPSIEIVDGELVSSGKSYAVAGMNTNPSAKGIAAAQIENREEQEDAEIAADESDLDYVDEDEDEDDGETA